MGNPNPVGKIKSSEQARAMGLKGGPAKKGSISLKACLKRLFASGEVDPDEYMKAIVGHAMVKGDAGLAKLIHEIHDGKIKEEIEITGKMDTTIQILPVKAVEIADTDS